MKKSEKNLASLFKNVLLMSGTPDWVQQEATKANRENECKCSPKTAMENGWICKPILNLISCTDSMWPQAVKAVYDRELRRWEESGKIFRPTILVNCSSIDDIVNLRRRPWFAENAGKLFHLISIHSNKRVRDKESNKFEDLEAEIDGQTVEAEEAYNVISKIDDQEDDLPVIVFQVKMIGEGINVRSFNAVVTASNCEQTAMQQIGRAVRNFFITRTVEEEREVPASGFFSRLLKKTAKEKVQVEKTFSKVKDGQANVYVINDNLKTLRDLIVGLNSLELTDDCFTWGKRLDFCTGSSPESVDEIEAILGEDRWEEMSTDNPDISEVMTNVNSIVLVEKLESFLSGEEDNDGDGIPDSEEFKTLISVKHKSGLTEVWTGKKTLPSSHDLLMTFKDLIVKFLRDDVNRLAWKTCRLDCLAMLLQDRPMAKFLDDHLKEEVFKHFSQS